jgi:hypothetical protein
MPSPLHTTSTIDPNKYLMKATKLITLLGMNFTPPDFFLFGL